MLQHLRAHGWDVSVAFLGYRYAHDEAGGFAAGETYFPDDMKAQRFYEPVDRGMEAKIKEKLNLLRVQNKK